MLIGVTLSIKFGQPLAGVVGYKRHCSPPYDSNNITSPSLPELVLTEVYTHLLTIFDKGDEDEDNNLTV